MVSKVIALSVALIVIAVDCRRPPIEGAKLDLREAERDWIVVREPKTSEESIAHCQSLGREMVYILTEKDGMIQNVGTKLFSSVVTQLQPARMGFRIKEKQELTVEDLVTHAKPAMMAFKIKEKMELTAEDHVMRA